MLLDLYARIDLHSKPLREREAERLNQFGDAQELRVLAGLMASTLTDAGELRVLGQDERTARFYARLIETSNPAWAAKLFGQILERHPEPRIVLAVAPPLARLLRLHREAIDPSGTQLDHLVRELFESKAGFYLRSSEWQRSPELLALHLALGEIFSDAQAWGSEQNSHSAIFQYARAAAIERRLRKLDPQRAPMPGLYARLAEAYLAAGERNKAARALMASATAFAHAGEQQETQRIAAELRSSYGDVLSTRDFAKVDAKQYAEPYLEP